MTRGNHTQRLRRVKKQLEVDDEVHLYYDEKIQNQTTQPAKLIADENAYSVWYKPYGMRSQGSKWGDHTTIQRWSELHLKPQRPVFTVHRLDRAATGLILLAHQKRTATALSEMFESKNIKKQYHAIVHGRFPNTPQTFTTPIDGRQAHTVAHLLQYDPQTDCTRIEVAITTGRKHQIRRHLSQAGYPIVGDRLYGSVDTDQNLQLTASHLAFVCPVSQTPQAYTLPDNLLPQIKKP